MKYPVFAVSLLAAFLAVGISLMAPRNSGAYNIRAIGEWPTVINGRLKPLDTVARTMLLILQGRQHVVAPDGRVLQPTEWLLDVLYRPEVANRYSSFKITHPEVLALFTLSPEQGEGSRRFSFLQLSKNLRELDQQAERAERIERPLRTSFQREVIQLRESIIIFQRIQASLTPPGDPDVLEKLLRLKPASPAAGPAREDSAVHELREEFSSMDSLGSLLPIPPQTRLDDLSGWKSAGAALEEGLLVGEFPRAAMAYLRVGSAWQKQQPDNFNAEAGSYNRRLTESAPALFRKCQFEARFNAVEPFTTSMALYVAGFLLAAFSWLKWSQVFARSAAALVTVAFVVTTLGIGIRMWLEGRPPVTNLYSSALFVGWGSVALCLGLEYFFKNAMATAAAGAIGFCTLLIAHHLALAGDTLEMMRAVLDSNFWLATHVVSVTIGYAATFLAGFLGLIYVLRGVFTRSLDRAAADALGRMIYGIVCFATLFSFVGTVLGGIWADQSWGRFWGWDPKENGALMIVMWNSIILHARWGGMIKQAGLARAVIFGNIVTGWSWFGVNMLGVGLHSYGFIDAAYWWLIAFVISQVAVIALSALPLPKWRSAPV